MAVCLGAVVVPVMRATGFHPLVIGSALLLGASVGGELFYPGAPELNTVFKDKTGTDTVTLARKHLPWVVFPQLVVSTGRLLARSRGSGGRTVFQVVVAGRLAAGRDVSRSQARGDDKAASADLVHRTHQLAESGRARSFRSCF